ncbi:MAG TPA: tectonin domain-containing protein [Bryobacteraceae bacterium]|nr:tectonin domain-containing protein [Bryobacteraceae bacterium]
MKTNINHTLWTGALVLSICSALTSTAAAQSFDQIPGFLTKIAIGNQTVAGINDSTQVVTWDTASSKFEPIPGGSGPFVTVAVGGGTLLQADEVWALNADQQIFRLSNGSFQQIPGQLTQIAIGPGFETCHPAEVWGLNNASGEVFRFDFCTGQFNQAAGQLSQISVGEHEVWGLNSAGAIFHWNFSTFVFDTVPGLLTQISAGPAGVVWGVDSNTGKVFRLSRDNEGAKFLEVTGQLAVISVGGNGVWGLNFAEGIFHFDQGSQQFVQVTGLLDSIAVGNGGGVWGLSSGQGIFLFKP